MTFRLNAVLLAGMLALVACAAPPKADIATPATPAPAESGEPSPAECAAKGGTIKLVGMMQMPACVIPSRDAGKACTDGDQCQGDCWASPDTSPGRDGKASGYCQPDNMPFGCHAAVEDGVLQPALCAD
jgi:putative hemolysin